LKCWQEKFAVNLCWAYAVYKEALMSNNQLDFSKGSAVAQSRNKHEARLHKLIGAAKQMNIEVRTEKLLREVGYRARSGRCRVNGRELILIDRDASIGDQIEFLAAELAANQSETPQAQPDNATGDQFTRSRDS
jgi:hypothetical protein